jgi:HAD superfamily hydrolase (TIGR01509 family)
MRRVTVLASERYLPPHRWFGDDAPNTLWICDVNGVLVDSAAVVREAFLATAAHFGFACQRRDVDAVTGLWLLEAYRRLDPGGDAAARRAFHAGYLRERTAELRACPGVRNTLAAARAAGVRIAAATSQGEIAEASLVSTGLAPLIECLVTQDDVLRPKPHPDAILRILSWLGADADDPDLDAVFVGDTTADIEAGRAAGVPTIGVTYGVSSEAEIRAAEPDFVIYGFDDMRSWLSGSESLPSRVVSDAAWPSFGA